MVIGIGKATAILRWLQMVVLPRREDFLSYAKDSRLFFIMSIKKCPISIEQLNRLPREIDATIICNRYKNTT